MPVSGQLGSGKPLWLRAGQECWAGAAAGTAAVRLFVDRATGARPDFTLDEHTVDAVVEICWRLDGMPLELELAAVKLRSMAVDQIVRGLDDRFRLLTGWSRAALPSSSRSLARPPTRLRHCGTAASTARA